MSVIDFRDLKHYGRDVQHLSRYTQTYGVLIVLNETNFTIAQISSNVEDWFEVSPQSVLNKSLAALLPRATVQELGDRHGEATGDFYYRFQFRQQQGAQSRHFYGLLRRYQHTLVVEVEPVHSPPSGSPPHYHERLKTFLNQIQPETSLQATAALVATEVQQVADLDRVLVYQFAADDSGMVIAEAAKDPHTPITYNGLRFPAFDIPPLARRTFSANRLRMIVDLAAPQTPLIPVINPYTNAPFEPIASMLMGVSSCHQEYYHNMGVRATVAIAIINESQLWGLIVGQHDTPKYLDPPLRNYCDTLGYLMSLELPRKQHQEIRQYRHSREATLATLRRELQQVGQAMVKALPLAPPPPITTSQTDPFAVGHRPETVLRDVLVCNGEQLLALVQSTGVALYLGESLTTLGQTPDPKSVTDLLRWLHSTPEYQHQDWFSIDHLGAVYPPAQHFQAIASGLVGLVLRLDSRADYILWFRPEIAQTVTWAGAPALATRLDETGTPQLCPRNSFELWQESVEGKCLPWHPAEIDLVVDLRDILTQAALTLSQIAWERAAEQARIANQAKSQFLAKMSHELRTPLNAILGFSQIMNRDEALSPEHHQHLRIINRSGEHLLALINDVLEMSKIEAGRLTFNVNSFDLHQMVEAVTEMLQLKASAKNLQLIFDYHPQLPQYISTDEGKLRQTLINLLDNAIKFTNEGWVKLRVFPGEMPTQVLFEVSDTGPGIAPEEHYLLFDPFTQTEAGRKSMQGTGLGLPICKQFVNLMGGEFTVESEVNQGSLFRFDIHITIADSPVSPPSGLGQEIIGVEPGHPHYRVLITEDGEENRLLLLKLLSPLGFDVRTANNGLEAISIWKEWHPHLILMDLLMPLLDGYEATKRIRALPTSQDTVIIALTANAFSDVHRAAIDAGCNDYLPKPFQKDRLLELMGKHLGICYCYREEKISPKTVSRSYTLNSQSLAVMPASWRSQLHDAALAMDEDRLGDLIAKIPPEQRDLADNLTYLVENFRLDLILEQSHGDD
jgi:light-regulated signal transduction histidine kinase (bacteriophytochrome)/DNA-binding response OmpR family regulator